MGVAELNAWMDSHFTQSAFRLETLQAYEVASDGSDFKRYLDGEPTWTPERKQPWLDHLAAETVSGLSRSRVRVVTHPISDYTRYECEWGYAPNVAAGEDVRILTVASWPSDGRFGTTDWWLVTDQHRSVWAALMHYGDDGTFRGAVEVDTRALLVRLEHERERLWGQAEPFTSWWAAHPHVHRNAVMRTR